MVEVSKLFVLVFFVCTCNGRPSLHRVCYYPYESSSEGFLKPDGINVTLCTHILFAFARIENCTLKPGSPQQIEGYKQLVGLKRKAPDLKIILSVGSGGGYQYSQMVSTKGNRTKFTNQTIELLRKYNFDGIDFDWEFPGMPPAGSPQDRLMFGVFLTELRKAYEEESMRTKRPRLSLSAAVVAVEPILTVAYDVPTVAAALDFINIMCYDYHIYHPIFPFTGHNSPLYAKQIEKGYFATMNIAWTAEAWQRKGAPKSKIVIGLPTYGHTFRLLRSNKRGLFAAAVGTTLGGDEITYSKVCEFLKSGAIRVFDNEARVPIASKGLDWVTYDDVGSIAEKSKWIKDNGYAGAMTWSIISDDWRGICTPGVTFPLHTAIYKAFAQDLAP